MIKKIALSLLCIGALSSSVQADEGTTGFIGLDLGYSQINDTFGVDDNDLDFGIKLGAQDNDWRTTFSYIYFDSGDYDYSQSTVDLSVDYFILGSGNTVKPYIGGVIGYTWLDDDHSATDDSGMVYGGEAGIVIDITESIDLDLGYRYSWLDLDTIDDSHRGYIGINYKF